MGPPPLFERQLLNRTLYLRGESRFGFRSETACAKNELPLVKPPLIPDERKRSSAYHIYGPFKQEISSQKDREKINLFQEAREEIRAQKGGRAKGPCREEEADNRSEAKAG